LEAQADLDYLLEEEEEEEEEDDDEASSIYLDIELKCH
jgi:hypothetical protein